MEVDDKRRRGAIVPDQITHQRVEDVRVHLDDVSPGSFL